MTRFIDLIYCSDLDDVKYLAYAPMCEYIKEGDIVEAFTMEQIEV